MIYGSSFISSRSTFYREYSLPLSDPGMGSLDALNAIRNGAHPVLRRNGWAQVADELGLANGPAHIVYKIHCSDLEYKDRAFLAAFFFRNGVPPHRAVEILRMFNIAATRVKTDKILGLYDWWGYNDAMYGHEDDPIVERYYRRCRYYAYDVALGRVVDLNGHLRHDGPGIVDRGRVVPPGELPVLGEVAGNGFIPPLIRNAIYGHYHC